MAAFSPPEIGLADNTFGRCVTHPHHYTPVAFKRIAGMSRQNIVDEKEIAFLPIVADCFIRIYFPDLI